MKTKILVAVLLMVFSLSTTTYAQKDKSKEKKKTEKVELIVNMHCQNCANRITENLLNEKGIRRVNANAAEKTVIITYRPTEIDKEKIIALIKELGYTVSIK